MVPGEEPLDPTTSSEPSNYNEMERKSTGGSMSSIAHTPVVRAAYVVSGQADDTHLNINSNCLILDIPRALSTQYQQHGKTTRDKTMRNTLALM